MNFQEFNQNNEKNYSEDTIEKEPDNYLASFLCIPAQKSLLQLHRETVSLSVTTNESTNC